MARCAHCNTLILFGGRRLGEFRFCNDRCMQRGSHLGLVDSLPPEVVEAEVEAVYRGSCPRCRRAGPVDVHHQHLVWSAIVVTSWRTESFVCCRSCAAKLQIVGVFACLLLGWWGLPLGLVVTPVQLIRNVLALLRPDPGAPSNELWMVVSATLAEHLAAQRRMQRLRDEGTPGLPIAEGEVTTMDDPSAGPNDTGGRDAMVSAVHCPQCGQEFVGNWLADGSCPLCGAASDPLDRS